MKKERQAKIKELIEKYKIDTQDELIKRLKESGFSATQATMSRDIKELKLTKISDGKNSYYYVFPNSFSAENINKLNASLTHLITSVNCAMNIIVIKTHAGMAQAVATGIDNIKSTDILGCVAGDDTIFIVTTTPEIALEIGAKIKLMMTEVIK
ncbi:MAG: arginine repressor [Bacteroidales bacterium]|nr:arginine repressor [Bacteroidales bacterium]MBQ7873498.1 arginine repressor [Clostridia bacterium]